MSIDTIATYENLQQSSNGKSGVEITVKVLSNIVEIEDIRQSWNLWQQHPNADMDFFLTSSISNPGFVRPYVLVAYRNGCPDALLVGRIVDDRIECRCGYATLMRPRVRLLTIVYGGVLGNIGPDTGRAFMREINAALKQGLADAAVFRFLNSDSLLYPLLQQHSSIFRRDHFPTLQPHWRMELSTNVEDVYKHLSSDHRWEIRRKAKKLLADHPDMNVVSLRSPSELDRIIRDVDVVAKKTYQRALGAGFADTMQMRDFLHLEAEKGWHRTYLLYIAGEPCAFWMGNIYKGTFHSNFLGYDSAYEKYSPGTFLFTKMIGDFCKEGVRVVDFGLGDARYKQRFGTCCWQEASAYIFAPSLRSLAINLVRTPALVVERTLTKVLERTGSVAKVKKLWRDRLRDSSAKSGPQPSRGSDASRRSSERQR